ncbi:MAG: T9SS type A sorting domain-containing protein [Ignavibacteriae bacterium]|nr:T9SS type A sorting domain-containing protein [Ignavibacteriota bacterium]MCB9220385.1 T9SS type A sorting domain-containing protein [Ignavibacteria bacterium]
MKTFVLTLIFIYPLVLLSNIWTKADGPYDYNSAYSIFSFNNDLYFYSSTDGYVYRNQSEMEEWLKLDTGFFADKGIIHYFNQKDNVVITTTQKGVYWSYDYGESWKFSDYKWYGNTFVLPYIAIVNQTIFLQSNNTSLYKLERGSDKFEKIFTDETKTDSIFADVMITKGNYIFAADPDQSFDRQPEYGELYISKDKGKTWKLSESMREYIINLLFHDDVLFAFTKEDRLYKSTDYGETWTTDTSLHIQGREVISYRDLIFACSNQVLVSSDGGENWESIDDGLDWYGCGDILVNDDKLYYLTTRKKIFSFDYEKKYWVRNTPLTDDEDQSFIMEERDTLFSTGGFTINYSTDKGASWQFYSESLYSRYNRLSNIFNRDSIFVVVDDGYTSIFISTDYGKNWKFDNLGIFSTQGWIRNIIIFDNRILLSSNKYGNYISEDAGLTWKKYENEVLGNEISIQNFIRLNELDLILYSSEGIYKTYDNGLTWEYEKVNEEVKVNYYTIKDKNFLYTLDRVSKKIYKSTDLGKTWITLNMNIQSNLIWLRVLSYNGFLILLTTTDVFISSNDGADWEKYEVNLLTPDGKELYFNNGIVSGEYLILTSEYGNWRAKLSDFGIEVKSSVETDFGGNYLYTYPPYPNPANSEVKVLFYWDINLPMTTDDINIYDISGKKINAYDKIRLVKLESHHGNLIWDCSSVQPGIYLINIKHGTEEKAVKVVVE